MYYAPLNSLEFRKGPSLFGPFSLLHDQHWPALLLVAILKVLIDIRYIRCRNTFYTNLYTNNYFNMAKGNDRKKEKKKPKKDKPVTV